MVSVMQPLREEHAELLPHIEAIKLAAEAAGSGDRKPLEETAAFLHHHLVPHAMAEDRVLYPVVESYLGEGATATMRKDHEAVGTLVGELDVLLAGDASGRTQDLQRVLYGLYQLVRVHFDKEEAIYVPLLEERMTPGEASKMFERMEAAAAEARGGSH